ncbi:Hypothetical protein FKW44_023082, partial [Caligus rogercresseyi]
VSKGLTDALQGIVDFSIDLFEIVVVEQEWTIWMKTQFLSIRDSDKSISFSS